MRSQPSPVSTNELNQRNRHIHELQEKLDETLVEYQTERTRVKSLETKLDQCTVSVEQMKVEHKQQLQVVLAERTSIQESYEEKLRNASSTVRQEIYDQMKTKLDESNQEVERLKKVSSETPKHLEVALKDVEEKEQKMQVITKDNEELRSKLGKLLGHANHHQKIKHLEKLKKELTEVRQERNLSQLLCERLKAKLRQYEQSGVTKVN